METEKGNKKDTGQRHKRNLRGKEPNRKHKKLKKWNKFKTTK